MNAHHSSRSHDLSAYLRDIIAAWRLRFNSCASSASAGAREGMQTTMNYSTRMYAFATLTFIALLMFPGISSPSLGHNLSYATATTPKTLLLDRNLHTDAFTHFKRSVQSFVPLLALLVATLVALDSIEDKLQKRPVLTPVDQMPDFGPLASLMLARVTVEVGEWPREFDLDADANGWIQVAREPQASRHRGN
jgi:hypothetical protein